MNNSRIMVSEELLQQLPELNEESLSPVLKSIALVYFYDEVNDFELSGPVFSFTATEEPEIELKETVLDAEVSVVVANAT